ncbi:MAG: hypothetical protein ACKV2T_36760 [Kofleriaceae bacterium]
MGNMIDDDETRNDYCGDAKSAVWDAGASVDSGAGDAISSGYDAVTDW